MSRRLTDLGLGYLVRGRTVSYQTGTEREVLTFPTPEEARTWAKERDSLERTAPVAGAWKLSRKRQMEGYL